MRRAEKSQSFHCGRTVFTLLFGCVVFSLFVSLVSIHEVGEIVTKRPPKRLISRGSQNAKYRPAGQRLQFGESVGRHDSVNRNIFNNDRPGAKAKPLLHRVAKGIENLKRNVFPTKSSANVLTTNNQKHIVKLSTSNGAKFKSDHRSNPKSKPAQNEERNRVLDSFYNRENPNNFESANDLDNRNAFDFPPRGNGLQMADSRHGLLNADSRHVDVTEYPQLGNPQHEDRQRLFQHFDFNFVSKNDGPEDRDDPRSQFKEFPKFHFHDDVENANNDIWMPQWIRTQSKFSSNPKQFMISHFKTFLSQIYAESAMEYVNEERYNVSYSNLNPPTHTYSSLELLCELKRELHFEHVDAFTKPFSMSFLKPVLPPRKPLASQRHFRSCAVVSSSGNLASGSHGAEIDAHDAVFRFNAAPTKGFESMVGGKTTFRILNSQVVAYPEKHNFLGDPLYREDGLTLLVWDPGNFPLDLDAWFHKPDHQLFSPYATFRSQNPNISAYIIHPSWIWNQWKFLQRHGVQTYQWILGKPTERVYPNPPTSGFMGITLAMELCDHVTAYEFVPSVNYTEACHYWDENELNRFCTLSTWHPASWEKRLMTRLHAGTEQDLYIDGKLKILGYSRCNA